MEEFDDLGEVDGADDKLKEEEFLALARKRLDKALGSEDESENRANALEDLLFLDGEQWPEEIKRDREEAGRPCLVINKLVEKMDQVIGDQRQNRPSIRVIPVDDISDPETAKIFDGIIRNIEAQSAADTAYDHAFEHAVACSYGAFRIDLEESESDFFNIDIRINRIENAFSVVWDPSAKKADKSDAKWCFIIEDMDKETYEDMFPGKFPVDFSAGVNDPIRSWRTNETVRIAEYWQRERATKTLYKWADGQYTDQLIEGHEPVEQKETPCHKVSWTKIDGIQILEPTVEWIGSYIPIVEVAGKELNINGSKKKRGLVRHAKDPQRAYNYSRSSEMEITALAPKTPWLVTKKMVANFMGMWKNAFKKTFPFLIYEPDPSMPGGMPKRELPAQIATGDAHLSAIASDEIKSTTGIYDASLGARSNETSGRAIYQRKMEGDVATFAYIDNLARSLTYAGKVLIDLIPKVYPRPRVMRLLNVDGTYAFQPINQPLTDAQGQPVIDDNTGSPKIYDLSAGKYDAVVTVGPSFTTQRQEASAGMMDFVKALPPAGQLMGDLIAKAQDWPGADEIAKRLKSLLPPGMAEDEDGDQGESKGSDPAQVNQMIQQAIQQFIQSGEGQKLQFEIQKQETELEIAKAKLEQEHAKITQGRIKIAMGGDKASL